MARARVFSKQGRYYVELPEGATASGEMEIFELRDGYYLLSMPLGEKGAQIPPAGEGRDKGNPAQEPQARPSEEERQLLLKLLAVRFDQRTPAAVHKMLGEGERKVLARLEEQGIVNVFQGRKYKDGVYNITDSVYPMLRGDAPEARPVSGSQPPGSGTRDTGHRTRDTVRPPGTSPPAASQPAATAAGTAPTYSLSDLTSRGYLILANNKEAYDLSEKLKREMKAGSVIGIKGFDSRFYVVTRNYYNKASTSILALLKDDMDVASIASKAGVEPEGCRAVLRILSENGEVVERKKDIFTAV